jgi:hypothetical protein
MEDMTQVGLKKDDGAVGMVTMVALGFSDHEVVPAMEILFSALINLAQDSLVEGVSVIEAKKYFMEMSELSWDAILLAKQTDGATAQ